MLAALEALRQSGKLDQAKILGYRGGLKLVARCPFHRETKPSFAVFQDGGYHCLGCGVSGVVCRKDGSGDDLLSHLNLTDSNLVQLHPKGPSAESTALDPKLLDLA